MPCLVVVSVGHDTVCFASCAPYSRTLSRLCFKVFGMGSGLVLHTAGQWARKFNMTKAKFNRNTLMLSVLGGGALGMFLFASSTGKGQVHKLHPIFQVGAMPPSEEELDYVKKVQLAKGDLDMTKLKEMRAVRRKSMMDSLEHGKGFSDSHGGHWYREQGNVDMDERKEIRAARRRTMNDSLTRHDGGDWSSRSE
eukprot:scaffold22638_cov138-Cylindrotheca_fusiformis.AAC.7